LGAFRAVQKEKLRLFGGKLSKSLRKSFMGSLTIYLLVDKLSLWMTVVVTVVDDGGGDYE
jgi:hypothetical protein